MTATATLPRLLTIEQTDQAIRFEERGKGHEGLVWIIQPGNPEGLQRAIDMVNNHGGPNMWKVTEVAPCCDGTGWTGNRFERCTDHYQPSDLGQFA